MTTITLEEIKARHEEIAALIAKLEQPKSFEYQGKQIGLNPGEIYAGTIITPGEYGSYHLILLPSETKPINWKDAMKWAAKHGGELPNRVEGALLFATLKHEFQEEWYWTREEHDYVYDYAWPQNFENGGQHLTRKYGELRARAVRRLIQYTAATRS
ncbi:MAG: DUF1566 domain-containing protein [Proteobacteria bacterium]|nr:DUF1566 domain-containing protein [Pseudomonadota bacterium]MCL2306803.1 DUF1566 domain-containing protein [Pseudomonadota bacterium]